MHFTTAFVLAAAGFAAAQSSTSSPVAPAVPSSSSSAPGACSDQALTIATCVKSTSLQLKACATNNWRCYCAAQQNVLTCYDGCPSDPDRVTAQQNLSSWCNAAKAQPESSTTSYKSVKTTAAGATSSSAPATTGGNGGGANTGFAQPSASGSAAAASSSGAAYAITPAGGLAAAILGGIALF